MSNKHTNTHKLLYYVLPGTVFSLLFVVFSLIVKKDYLVTFDFDSTVRLQDHIPQRIDPFFSFFSILGSFEVTTTILFVVLIATRKLRNMILVFAYGGAHIIEILGKSLLSHPGPPFMFFRYNLGFYFPSSYVHTASSYPSGHSFRTIFLSVLFIFFTLRSRKLHMGLKIAITASLLGIDVIMLISRVSLGEHWTTDVIGGTLLALGMGLLSVYIIPDERS